MTKLSRIIRFAFQNVWRNKWLSMITVSMVFLAFLSVNFFVLAHYLISVALDTIEDRASITIQFKKGVQEDDISLMRDEFRTLSEVKSVEYLSADNALKKLKEKYEKEGDVSISEALSHLDENPLFSSLIVKAWSVEQYGKLQLVIEKTAFKDIIEKKNIDDRKELIGKITNFKENIRKIGVGIIAFFGIIAFLVIFNTIRMSIYTRQKEIFIMKLVGATHFFIRAPLIIEAFITSTLAIILTILVWFPLLGMFQPFIANFFDGQAIDMLGFFSTHFIDIFGIQLLAALALSALSSSFALGRYLKV